ncbi:MAG: hypothetical protein ACOC34_04505 [Thermotogota bacterium]
MYLKGAGIEEILNGINIETMSEVATTLIYSIFDEKFDCTSTFISGAPSVHLVIERTEDVISTLFFLDLKSVSFSFSPDDTLNISIPDDFLKTTKTLIWKNAKIVCLKIPSMTFIVDEIKFFSDYNITILGYTSTSKTRFEELSELIKDIPASFTLEETEKTHYNALLINLIAVESYGYEIDNNNYIVPNVGMEGMELWLGTNPRFFLDIVDDKDDELKRETKKYLYNIIFARVAKTLSEYFSIHHYSVSKVEKGFIIDKLSKEKILEFLKIVKVINHNAKDIFNTVLKNAAFVIGSLEKNAEKKLNLLKTFYDEKNIIGIITIAYSNEQDQHRQMLEILLNEDIPSMIKGIKDTVQNIDELLNMCIKKGGKELELF